MGYTGRKSKKGEKDGDKMDILTEERVYPCEPATAEALSNMIWGSAYGFSNAGRTLRRITCGITEDNIPWHAISAVSIIGTARDRCNNALLEAGLQSGIYVNRTGDRLLLIHPGETAMGQYLARLGTRLKKLKLYNSTFRRLDLSSLTVLERLSILDNEKLESLKGLGQLTSLSSLYLYECSSLTQLPGLEKLTNLSSLDLSNCSSLTQLPGLEKLTNLSSLDLSYCSSLTQLPGLEKLTNLSSLDLSGCSSLTQLPGLEKLTNLSTLRISEFGSLTQVPGLEKLTNLSTLRISECGSLTQVPGLEKLTNLSALYLSNCSGLTQLPGLEKLTNLSTLNLFGCSSLKEIPQGIKHIKSLRMLDLGHMKLRTLPDWLPEIAEKFSMDPFSWDEGNNRAIVYLGETTVDDIPDMSIFERPYEMVVKWFEDRKRGKTRKLNEIKVVFLGDGEAGKSHTIARLINNGGAPKDYVDVRTPGIVIKDIPYPIGDREVMLHLWDFGGQDILHSMHRIFLTERTIYVVLVDGSTGTQDDRARYWLQNIQSFAKDAPVVLVLNKLDDGLQADVNAVDLRNKFKGLKQIVKLSALQYPQERFNREFTDVLLQEIEKTGYLDAEWPSSWIDVKYELEHMDQNYIRGTDYLKICKDRNVNEHQQPLLRWFHDLGISFCYCDNEHQALEDYVVLKPNWITNALYIILFNEREGGNGGLVPVNTIRSMLSMNAPNRNAIKRVIPDAYYHGYDVDYVLDVFRIFKLSFQKGKNYEFFPMLADINAKPVAKEYAEEKTCLEFNMEFDYLPNNLLHRLMVDRSGELDMDNVWRTGARFQLKALGYSAVVVIDGNVLRFFIRHADPMHRPNTYLAILKANVDRIVHKMGLKAPTCQLIYKVNGKRAAFSYERLLKLHARGRREEYCEALDEDFPIEDILNQSAPDGLEDEKKLLDAIVRSCQNIQGEPSYRLDGNDRGKEDLRNRRVRDDLHGWGYDVKDQTQRGLSGSGKGIGEIDILINNDQKRPWTMIEALRVSGDTKKTWDKHLDKLIGNYNCFGARFLYLLTYVDADEEKFGKIWKGYQKHIKEYNPGKFTYLEESFTDLTDANSPQNIMVAKCRYTTEANQTTVYHIFAQIPL